MNKRQKTWVIVGIIILIVFGALKLSFFALGYTWGFNYDLSKKFELSLDDIQKSGIETPKEICDYLSDFFKECKKQTKDQSPVK